MDTVNPSTRDLCLKAVRGNPQAYAFLELITGIFHLWDDLHDKDKPRTDKEIDRVFWDALIDLPRNQFYMANFYALNNAMIVAIQNWHAANEMEETESDYDKEIAFILRSSYSDLVTLCAVIVGGYEWGRQITSEIHRYWHNEGLAGYKANLDLEKKARLAENGMRSMR